MISRSGTRERKLRTEAQLYAARVMVLDPAEHVKALRAATMAALAVYAHDPQATATTWTLENQRVLVGMPQASDGRTMVSLIGTVREPP